MAGRDDDAPPRILPTLIVGGLVVVVGLTVLGWVIGAILSTVRFLVVVGIAIAIVYALASARADR